MLGDSEINLYRARSIGELFVIETHLLSTRTADVYKAIDKKLKSPVSLWKLRQPLPPSSAGAEDLLSRISALAGIRSGIIQILGCGVADNGEAFVVIPALDGQLLAGGALESAEAERRFIAAIQIIAAIHDAGAICGDICSSSFWIVRSGDVRFIGVMGGYEMESASGAPIPPVETIPFLAPEQQVRGEIGPSADVFALGVLGYLLFCKRHPYGAGYELVGSALELKNVQDPGVLAPKSPSWLKAALFKALDPDPRKRFPSAGEFLKAIGELKAGKLRAASSPAKTGRIISSAHKAEDGVMEFSQTARGGEKPSSALTPPQGRKLALLLAGIFAGAVILFGAVVLPRRMGLFQNHAALLEELQRHRSLVSSPDLKSAIDTLSEPGASSAEREKQLQTAASSDDPLAHDVLVRIADKAYTEEFRAQAEKAVVDRARRFGLMRSAEQVKQWLRQHAGVERPANYLSVLQSLDSTLPIDARSGKLRAAYASDPQMVLRLSAALALDSGDLAGYQPVLAQLVGDAAGLENADKRSALALIMFNPELSALFGDDIVQRLGEISSTDLPWLLGVLAQRMDPGLRAVAQAALDKKAVDGPERKFLELLVGRSDIPTDAALALVHGAAGHVSKEDIGALGRWYDLSSADALMLILAASSERDLREEAFDVLAGKAVSSKAANQFISWIRSKHFNDRAEFGKLVVEINALQSLKRPDIEAFLAKIEPYLNDRDLVGLLSDSESVELQTILVQKYSNMLGFDRLLNMLSAESKNIRIEAVRALKAYNDIAALKLIIEHYEKERDPDVRRAYKDTFWMIQEREERASGPRF